MAANVVNLKYCEVRLQEVTFMHTFFVVLLVIVSIALIAVVLLQSGKSAGLSGAISGGAESLFGKQKARGIDLILHRITVVLSVLFFLLTLAVTYFKI
jgi:preprotein translocase subunit SecG